MNLALIGYGKMGRMLERLAPEYGFNVTLVLDINNNAAGEGFTHTNFKDSPFMQASGIGNQIPLLSPFYKGG